ncbi:4,4'-diaponeurosporenoate glycosyltransferase [Nocardioides aquaticus]|uniref:4,4'-diaponeurosporenoate glycosyltransferase n=3 Tax=Nocardioides aquaticus TaxID=160826 RepID=A0ABX8EFA8_9ACTN|nr:glycosyltransferase family 2 protein [Nocardioides aquaticus]QVT78331.1 4,4'-diaponeurosporenoate glycosyltransferase [Nocardioides aquaticus]
MTPGRTAVRFGSALAVASLALTVDNLRRVRTPDPTARPAPEPVCVLLPVRDEERHVTGCVAALLATLDRYPGPARLVVLDDGSTDGTGRLLADLAARDARVEVVPGSPLPAGWLGKTWACHQLAQHAGDAAVLVFVDADVRLAPSALPATMALLRDAGLDLVCPYPRQQAEGVAERLVQPLLQWSWMSTLPLGLAETSPRPSLGAANGQLLAVDAGAYRRLGGHAAVRGDVLEDLALLRALKAVGGRGGVADGSAVATCRMYDGGRALREGYAKSLWTAFGSPAGGVAVVGLLVWAHVVPAVAALGGSRAGTVGYAAGVASRALVARRTGGRAGDALAHPVSVVALGLLVLDSLRGHRRGTLRWKGRLVSTAVVGP